MTQSANSGHAQAGPSQHEQTALVASEQTALRSVSIFLADDDEINRSIIQHLVDTRPGFVLTLANDGKAALEITMTKRFDVMIFDRQMPHITGDRVIRHLRASRTVNSTTPMILFTASADSASISSDADASGKRGLADMILPKPIRADEFFAAIDRLLEQS